MFLTHFAVNSKPSCRRTSPHTAPSTDPHPASRANHFRAPAQQQIQYPGHYPQTEKQNQQNHRCSPARPPLPPISAIRIRTYHIQPGILPLLSCISPPAHQTTQNNKQQKHNHRKCNQYLRNVSFPHLHLDSFLSLSQKFKSIPALPAPYHISSRSLSQLHRIIFPLFFPAGSCSFRSPNFDGHERLLAKQSSRINQEKKVKKERVKGKSENREKKEEKDGGNTEEQKSPIHCLLSGNCLLY